MNKFTHYLLIIIALPFIGILNTAAQSWGPVGSGIYGQVSTMTVYNGELYAGGNFLNVGSLVANHIAKWDGNTWTSLGAGTDGNVKTMTVYNGELYIGGTFTTVDGSITATNLAKWNGTTWSAVGTGANDLVSSLTVDTDNNILYISGDFSEVDGVASNRIARYDGIAFSSISTGLNWTIQRLFTHNSYLYAGGSISLNGINSIARWNGTAWDTPTNMGVNNSVYAFAMHNGELYAGGEFEAVNIPGSVYGYNKIGKWNGTDWDSLGSGMGTASNIRVNDLISLNGNLIAAGTFIVAGGDTVNNIASWDGSEWSPIESGFNNTVRTMTVYNNELYVGGNFTMAGSTTTYFIAKQSLPTAVKKLSAPDSFIISPNPAADFVNVNYEFSTPVKTQLYSIDGRLIRTIFIDQTSTKISLEGLSAGIYFLKLSSTNGIHIEKVIKE